MQIPSRARFDAGAEFAATTRARAARTVLRGEGADRAIRLRLSMTRKKMLPRSCQISHVNTFGC